MSEQRFYCYYGSRFYTDNGVRVERAFGGRKMKYHHDIEVVRCVLLNKLRPVPRARGYIYEVFPIEPGHVLRPVPADAKHWWGAGKRTRLVFVEEVKHGEDRLIRLVEQVMSLPKLPGWDDRERARYAYFKACLQEWAK